MPGSELLAKQPGSLLLAADMTPPAAFSRTFSNGLTDSGTVVTNDLNTGKAGGQTATGGTAASEALTLQSTTNATKGKIFLGSAQRSWFDEAAAGSAISGTGTGPLVLGLPNGANYSQIQFQINSAKVASVTGTSIGNLDLSAGPSSGDIVFFVSDYAASIGKFTANGNLCVGLNVNEDTASALKMAANKTVASAAGAVWDGFKYDASTLTLTGTTTVTELAAARILRPTITDSSAVTITTAGTLVVDGEPIAGGLAVFGSGTALQGAKSLWVKRGTVQFDGTLLMLGNGSNATIDAGGGTANIVINAQQLDLQGSAQLKGVITSANNTVATVLGSLGPTGSRTTVQKWLKVLDTLGNPFWAPLF